MRHADQPTVAVDADVDAPPARIWPLITDISMPTRGSTELRKAEWLDDGATRVGRRFRGTNGNAAFGEWQTTSTVIEYDEPAAFAWAVGDVSRPITTWRFSLTCDGARTRVRQSMRLGVGRSGLTRVIEQMPEIEESIIEFRLAEFQSSMRATLTIIKELAERP